MENMTNQQIAQIFFEMAALHEMEDEHFQGRAYERVAQLIEGLPEEIRDLYLQNGRAELEKLPGVGKNIANHLEELMAKGTFAEYEKMKKALPVKVMELMTVEGVGPKNVKTLWKKLKIRNLADLEEAARSGKIRKLENFGEKSERKILAGIEFLHKTGGRKVLGYVLPELRRLEAKVKGFRDVEQAALAGSVRRRKETIGDVDILAISAKPESVMDQFVALPEVQDVIGRGPTKVSVHLKEGINADLRVVGKESFGAALQYFTGSQAHNIRLRHLALTYGWKLNEYGLFKKVQRPTSNVKKTDRDTKGEDSWERIAGRTEEGIYEKLGLSYIEPELREDRGEVEAAQKNKLPKIIKFEDLKGDLQIQTSWSDGKGTIEEMAQKALQMGLEYILITDHTKSLTVANGLDEKRLQEQSKEIAKVNQRFKKQGKNFRVLRGSEVDILKDGSLDLDDEALAKLDVVGASVHSHFELSRAEQTKRLVRAMRSPHVDIIFHLTTRVIGKRKPIDIDLEEILRVAKETKTVLEIDAFPDRLDISELLIRRCVELGIKMSIDSDAHAPHHSGYLEYGVAQARRGWATKKDIINAQPLAKMFKMLK